MWKPRLNFIRIHFSLLFSVDVKDLKTYQQVYLYVVPIITNMMFLNAIVIPVRLFWFRQRLYQAGVARDAARNDEEAMPRKRSVEEPADAERQRPQTPEFPAPRRTTTITFDDQAVASGYSRSEKQILRVPPPRESDRGEPITEIYPSTPRNEAEDDPDAIKAIPEMRRARPRRNSFHAEGTILHAATSIEKAATAFYSAQTMANNLGFALTPDSMASFKDATWPMLVMTFLAFAGNTCYPVFLRCIIWLTSMLVPKDSQTRETLQFILDHPRRCYTLLFPGRPTWILFGTVVVLNFIDVVLIIVLDLDNPAVNDLPMGPRILSALFQAASARHTGTATLNLVDVNPAVQFSLLTMMYIAVFPIAISVRASNTYEERTVGIWASEGNLNEENGVSYVMVHIRNQLTFDLWYIFLGTFLICIAEARLIMDLTEPTFSVFAIMFEVTSAYANVGLSLGGPYGLMSMSGHYTIFSKVVICAMMIRGRHRGLPYALDRAITLPADHTASDEDSAADQWPKSLSLGRTQSSGARSAP
ncbi:hypothetical protein ACHAQA_005090 [Verticillium albo-atrum]